MWAQIFGAITRGTGSLLSAQADYSAAKQSAQQMGYDADAAEQQGQAQAEVIRRSGRRILGTQRAAIASSGVQIGEGSAGEVERETVTDTEHDAFQAILSGQRQALALRTQAKIQKIQAKAQAMSVLIDPLFANSSSVQGWKTYDPTYQGKSSYSPALKVDPNGYGITPGDVYSPVRGGN